MFGAQIATRSPASIPDAINARAVVFAAVGELGEGEPLALVDQRLERRELGRPRVRRLRGWSGAGRLSGMVAYDIRKRGAWAWPRPATSPTRASRGSARASAFPSRTRCRRTTRCPRTDTFRNVAVAYGDDNPLWCDPDYGAKTRWESAIAPPPLVGGDTLVGEDEVTAVAAEHARPDEGRPAARRARVLRRERARVVGAAVPAAAGVPAQRARRRARQAERVRRAGPSTSGPRRCSATRRTRCSSGQYRLMVRTEREKARERKKYDDVDARALHRRADRRDRRAVRPRDAPRRRAALVGGRRARATRSARW